MRLAGPRRPYKEQAAVLGDEANGGQVEDEGLGCVWVKGSVEEVQCLHVGDAGDGIPPGSVLAGCCSELSVAGIFSAFSLAEWPKECKLKMP